MLGYRKAFFPKLCTLINCVNGRWTDYLILVALFINIYSKTTDIISVVAPDESVHVALQLIISVLSNLNFSNKSLPIVAILALS